MSIGLAYAAVVLIFSIIGLALTKWIAPNPLLELDDRLARDLADSRTQPRTELAHWGAFLSDTSTKLVVTPLLVAAALARWRRWHEGLLIAGSLVFEAGAYIVISHIVGRQRPDVPRLIDSPVAASFPSGHAAAATVYLALAVVVGWHARRAIAWVISATIVGAVAITVALARMYQGMHYLSDVVAGVALGLVTVAITAHIIAKSIRSPIRTDHPPASLRPSAVGIEPAVERGDQQ